MTEIELIKEIKKKRKEAIDNSDKLYIQHFGETVGEKKRVGLLAILLIFLFIFLAICIVGSIYLFQPTAPDVFYTEKTIIKNYHTQEVFKENIVLGDTDFICIDKENKRECYKKEDGFRKTQEKT